MTSKEEYFIYIKEIKMAEKITITLSKTAACIAKNMAKESPVSSTNEYISQSVLNYLFSMESGRELVKKEIIRRKMQIKRIFEQENNKKLVSGFVAQTLYFKEAKGEQFIIDEDLLSESLYHICMQYQINMDINISTLYKVIINECVIQMMNGEKEYQFIDYHNFLKDADLLVTPLKKGKIYDAYVYKCNHSVENIDQVSAIKDDFELIDYLHFDEYKDEKYFLELKKKYGIKFWISSDEEIEQFFY